jgi:hypothetical protein
LYHSALILLCIFGTLFLIRIVNQPLRVQIVPAIFVVIWQIPPTTWNDFIYLNLIVIRFWTTVSNFKKFMEVFNPLSNGHTKVVECMRTISLIFQYFISPISPQTRCMLSWITYTTLSSLLLMHTDAHTPTLHTPTFLTSMWTYLRPTTLPAHRAPTIMLADLRPTTLLALSSLLLMHTDAHTPTLHTPTFLTSMWTFRRNIFWFFGDRRAWRTKIKRIQSSLNHLNTYSLKVSKWLRFHYNLIF